MDRSESGVEERLVKGKFEGTSLIGGNPPDCGVLGSEEKEGECIVGTWRDPHRCLEGVNVWSRPSRFLSRGLVLSLKKD